MSKTLSYRVKTFTTLTTNDILDELEDHSPRDSEDAMSYQIVFMGRVNPQDSDGDSNNLDIALGNSDSECDESDRSSQSSLSSLSILILTLSDRSLSTLIKRNVDG